MDSVDVVIIGGGVVGLAIAAELARRGREPLILEAAETFGTEVSSRNSGVIHAGIYYPRGSLRARLCVKGRDLLYEFCARHDIPHKRCGKIIVASSEAQRGALEQIHAAAAGNGVPLGILDRSQALALEPEVSCVAALLSETTGIIDVHAYMLALLGLAEDHGAVLVCRQRVTRLVLEKDGVLVGVEGGEPSLRARLVINSAGLDAPQTARLMEGFPREHIPGDWLAKGNYFTLTGLTPFKRLVYPIPEPGGLGVHVTLDLDGRARFGPDVEWVQSRDYNVDPQRAQRFYAAIRSYWPHLKDNALQPGYSGIRPKITGPGEPAADFRIEGPAAHGVSSVINLFGIESPGLTSSLAIAQDVAEMAGR